ncbi:hypothetical protein [Photorhabdus bodei]|uniref:Uncharacterized protein n=1 Tax=Photorhabdus bodei TaxID=2029681 RepID=A0AAW6BP76_9GAMM|nr:hypothetical protein [Photorhabdus bodei]MDB6374566.1 hypothetical protein [Photorhabdus bodei]
MKIIWSRFLESVVDINGMTEEAAARTVLRNLIREKQIDPQSEQ